MRWAILPREDWRLVLGGALLTALAYPPFHLLFPSFLALVPVTWLLLRLGDAPGAARRMLVCGFWYGLLSQGLVLYWIVVALWHFTPLSALGYAATIAILAGYSALVFAGAAWIRARVGVPLALGLPVLWTAAEWLIAHQGDIRFPWLGLGTSLTGYPTLVQVADLIGARGVTFLLVAANVALAEAWLLRAHRAAVVRRVGVVMLGVTLVTGYGVLRARAVVLRDVGTVAVIQPNVGFDDKWMPGTRDSLMSALLTLSDRAVAATSPDLVVWPEAAVPGTFYNRPSWRRALEQHVARYGVPAVVGALDAELRGENEFAYYNAAFVVDHLGNSRSAPVYHKRYLVPITERVPFVTPEWFGNLEFFGGAEPGRSGPVYATRIGRFGILICYESIFENLAREYRRDGAEFLLNITNDAWFGRSSAPRQHLAHLVMRAIETRAGIARAANTGISAFIDPLGRIHDPTPLFEEAFAARVLTTSDERTVYVRLGDWVGLTSVIGAVLLVAYARWRR
ncbi:MAG TPA: apolipoprotein N-acyltransferase [Gemmatimonadales bacterium]